MPQNVFVLGLDDGNRTLLRRLPGADQYRFHTLLDVSEVRIGFTDYRACLAKACAHLESFGGSIDAITGYWDFPVTSLIPVLCERYGLPSPSLESVVKCEHKYWSRLEQCEVVHDYPRFGLLNLVEHPALPPGLDYPVWIKPIKSSSSKLAFRVGDDRELDATVDTIREHIDRVSGPFDAVLERVTLPATVAAAGARSCIAEEEMSGIQVTAEGYVFHHEPHVYGVIDSLHYPGSSSFLRYQYPSTLPAHLIDRVTDLSKRVITRLGLRSTTFDIEFFVDTETGRTRVLEVNPRLSQSHAWLFEQVEGVSHHHCMVNLALGREPHMPRRQGDYAVAAKCFLRRFTDGTVREVPTPGEVAQVERDVPGTTVAIATQKGARLSRQYARDSYSYELAVIQVAAGDEKELTDKYERCVRALRFDIED